MQFFNKILIANRGEIAIRIMQTCQKMGISTVAIFSDADAEALFVKMADEAINIGGFHAAESYLNQQKIIRIAKQTKADAIHPAYGFLAENANFARLCQQENLVFIGPNAAAIEAMGSKIRAKQLMKQQGVPVIAGYNGEKQDSETLKQEASKIGFPVLLKASAGGGGKGMRIVRHKNELTKAIAAAKREAKNAFGDDTLLIEKYFDSARHIEFQIFGDQHGNVVHCFERECSIQRRHQKVIEETPSVALTPLLRQKMGDAAVLAAKAISYDNAGTVEFILTPDNEFYFLEVNTRLQVEHPVTEMVTKLDLVQLQIEVAQGLRLPFEQKDIQQKGHAIECRLYAEDAANNFLPATGDILLWQTSSQPNVRYDTGIATHSKIDIYYDPMIAKVIVYAKNRQLAIQKMKRALEQTVLLGLVSNKDFLVRVLQNEHFRAGNFDTHFLGKVFRYEAAKMSILDKQYFAIAAHLWLWQQKESERKVLKSMPSGWRNNFYAMQQKNFKIADENMILSYRYNKNLFSINIDNQNFVAKLLNINKNGLYAEINGHRLRFAIAEKGENLYLHQDNIGNCRLQKVSKFGEQQEAELAGSYKSPMPAEVVKLLVKVGDSIKMGDALLILSSMKMENTIEAYENGIVSEIFVAEKMSVEADTVLLQIETAIKQNS